MENKKYTKPILIGLTLVGGSYSLPASAVEGNDVLPSDAPYMVYFKYAHCSGTLIAPKTVLTAHHCVGLGAQKGNHAYLLHSGSQEVDENGRIPNPGIKVKIVEAYTADHIFEPSNGIGRDEFDDIAIVELESMPEGVTFLPVANQSIPLGAEVFPIGYSTSSLKRMPIPAIVAAKENSPDYEREVDMAQCNSSKYFSNNFFTQEYSQIDQESCDWAETRYEYRQEHGIYKPNRYSITIENPPLDSSDSRFDVNEFGTVLTKYSTFRGDSGGPLIYQGKVYGVASTGVNSHSQVHNQATFYAGFTRPGVFNWIVDTVKKIQNKSMEKNVSTAVLDAPIVFPID
ncbi:trypsin-like serine protease [Vibrio anguillarum]|uniref:trypsin-like serine protease n=3 Tax=Vibrio anguillarum TaxID=55601 RepID=UPI00097E24CE|nr:trypsin-like serine protease [Vibrio anguillarum]MBF4232488.1 trypsin [Vibrio anguillarum]MBF4283658.1 trypsin [Vibrio anguillarum]MBF4288303.1 trypsin [Vibrio anguillarum]MBF4342038.1 trypsin [Vibrio anguillarum]MBF4358412.1 trypsin [Vibrio anguillarum]